MKEVVKYISDDEKFSSENNNEVFNYEQNQDLTRQLNKYFLQLNLKYGEEIIDDIIEKIVKYKKDFKIIFDELIF